MQVYRLGFSTVSRSGSAPFMGRRYVARGFIPWRSGVKLIPLGNQSVRGPSCSNRWWMRSAYPPYPKLSRLVRQLQGDSRLVQLAPHCEQGFMGWKPMPRERNISVPQKSDTLPYSPSQPAQSWVPSEPFLLESERYQLLLRSPVTSCHDGQV